MGGTASKFTPAATGSRRADTPFNAYSAGAARRNSSGYVVTPADSGGTCRGLFRKKTGVSANDEPAPARRPTRKPSDPNDAVFSSSHAHPMVANLISELAQSGILDELDDVGKQVAAARVSPFATGDDVTGPDPSAPVKTRARSILRRNSSITVAPDHDPASAPNPEELAQRAGPRGNPTRKLTWSSFEKVAGKFISIRVWAIRVLTPCFVFSVRRRRQIQAVLLRAPRLAPAQLHGRLHHLIPHHNHHNHALPHRLLLPRPLRLHRVALLGGLGLRLGGPGGRQVHFYLRTGNVTDGVFYQQEDSRPIANPTPPPLASRSNSRGTSSSPAAPPRWTARHGAARCCGERWDYVSFYFHTGNVTERVFNT
mgnify:FL=1